jgi:hypothetical protein
MYCVPTFTRAINFFFYYRSANISSSEGRGILNNENVRKCMPCKPCKQMNENILIIAEFRSNLCIFDFLKFLRIMS